MKTDDLIHELSTNLPPVRTSSARKRFALFFAIAAAFTAGFAFLIHLRPDLPSRFSEAEFVARHALLLGAAFLSLRSLATILAPDKRVSNATTWALSALAIALGLELALRFFQNNASAWPPATFNALHCAVTVVLAAGLLSAVFLTMARSQATTHPASVGALCAIASVALSSLVVDLACANENPIHLLFSHFLAPSLLLLLIFGFAATRALKW